MRKQEAREIAAVEVEALRAFIQGRSPKQEEMEFGILTEGACSHWQLLRHTAATEIRRAFGLEAAQLALGHSSAQVTDAVYAERDHGKVAEIMRQVG